MFDSNQFFGVSAAGAFYPKTISQSLRFEDGDSAYLSRTPSSDGDRTTWTWSGWVKRGNFDTHQTLFSSCSSATNGTFIRINEDNQLQLRHLDGGTASFSRNTVALLRDPSAWYHFVVAYDSNETLATDRIKMWINGTQITEFAAGDNTPPSTKASDFNLSGRNNLLGTIATTSAFFDGYMAEVHFTDGTAYTADDFGELRSGIWVPKEVDVTYGTNGFYLDFADSAAIGDDESGNGNDWTVNNLVASDVVPDSPTNNFCTLNSVEFVNNSGFLSEGNLKISDTSSANLSASGGTIGMKSGKWYWEAHLIVQENGFNIGVVKDTESATSGTWNYTKTNFYAINGIGTSYVSDGAGAQNAAGTSFAQGDTVQVAYDADTGKLYFGKNGTWLNSADPAAGTGNLETTSDPEYGYHPATSTIGDSSGYSDVIMNFGQDDTFAGNLTAVGNTDGNGIGSFKYTVPSGFLALCTANLPDPVIDPAQDDVPEDHFDVLASAGLSSYSGLSFAPDFLWNKIRTAVGSNVVADSIRGDDKRLVINSTNAEDTLSGYFNLTSNGFTTTYYNSGGEDYVYFFWKAGGTGVSNTDGSITSTVSANTDAGFSIVGYTGLGPTLGDGSSIGHGLNQAPELVIFKNRSASSNWFVMGYPTNPNFATDGSYLLLEGNAAMQTSSGNEIEIGSSVITFIDSGTTIADANPMIAYCFHSVDGYSKVGSYVGNGSTDGTFVYTGFRPKWIMVKSTGTQNWYVRDTERDPYNVSDTAIFPDLTNAETSTSNYDMDIVSNGFKHRYNGAGHNASGVTYIYLAFAEQPVKYSNAR
jgi:hypothetical protein